MLKNYLRLAYKTLFGLTPKQKEFMAQNNPPDELFKANQRFKNRHQGKRCFILASGPSINQQDLTLLKDEICFSVSSFFLHNDISVINPKYHVLAPTHHPFDFSQVRTVFQGLNDRLPADCHVFLGHKMYEFSYHNFLKANKDFLTKEFSWINYSDSLELSDDNFDSESLWDIAGKPYSLRTVIYSAICIAQYMGFKEIYLLGCDHDYLKDTSRITDHHFYKDSQSYSDKEHLSEFTTEKWFYEYYRRWKDYRLMRTYLQSRNVTVYNATLGGMLDVFERRTFEDLF